MSVAGSRRRCLGYLRPCWVQAALILAAFAVAAVVPCRLERPSFD